MRPGGGGYDMMNGCAIERRDTEFGELTYMNSKAIASPVLKDRTVSLETWVWLLLSS